MAQSKKFKSLPKSAKKAAFAQMDKAGTRRVSVKKLKDVGKNWNPKTKMVSGLPTLPKPTKAQTAQRIASLKKIAGKSAGASALLKSIKKK